MSEPATGKLQKICDRVKRDTEKKVLHGGEHFGEFAAVIYRQEPAGTFEIYSIKVHVGGTTYVHIYVHEDCTSGGIRFVDALYPMTLSEIIVPIN